MDLSAILNPSSTLESDEVMTTDADGTQNDSETDYFESYGDLNVHELMLKDKPRMDSYLKAIQSNADDFKDKVVLDVGAGTGILSMFCSRNGAKKVYAVEASKFSFWTHILVENNGLEDKIEVIEGRMEEVELKEKVDIIISEWMGFFLLHESMFQSVFFARDKFLKPNGKMFPSRARMYLCPVSMDAFCKDKFTFWEDIYGLDFSSLIHLAQQKALSQPEVTIVSKEQLLSEAMVVKEIDCNSASTEELKNFSTPFSFKTTKEGIMHGFCCWFDVVFDGQKEKVVLSTAPGDPETHWKQSVFLLPEFFKVSPGITVEGKITFSADINNQRHYNVSIEMADSANEDSEDPPDCDCARCQLLRALNVTETDTKFALKEDEDTVESEMQDTEEPHNLDKKRKQGKEES